jgi:hypothetical protein
MTLADIKAGFYIAEDRVYPSNKVHAAAVVLKFHRLLTTISMDMVRFSFVLILVLMQRFGMICRSWKLRVEEDSSM